MWLALRYLSHLKMPVVYRHLSFEALKVVQALRIKKAQALHVNIAQSLRSSARRGFAETSPHMHKVNNMLIA